MAALGVVKKMGLILTDRERTVVALAMVTLQDKGVDALKETTVIQVDQSFGRHPVSSSPLKASACVIPNGKYVVTGKPQFRLLTAKEMMSLQGFGPEDLYRLQFDKLPPKLLQSMAGNASLGQCLVLFST